jgi:hypothetical protein
MRREMNRLFDDAFGGFGLPNVLGPALRQMPAAPKIEEEEAVGTRRCAAIAPH